MSELKTAYMLTLAFLSIVSVINIRQILFAETSSLDHPEMQRVVYGGLTIASFGAFALGRVLWGIIYFTLATVGYYLYRRNGGGGKKHDESLFKQYTPW